MKKIILSSVVALTASSYLSAESYYFTPTIGKVIHESSELNKDTIFGLRAGMAIEPKYGVDTLEFAYDRQSSVDYTSYNQSTNINRLSLNALKHYKYSDVLTPYALAGIGCEHITNDVSYTDNSPFFDLGLGLKYKLPNEMSLMTDIRHIVRIEDFDNHTVFNIGLQIPFGTKTVKMAPVVEQKVEAKAEPKKEELKPVVVPVPKDSDKDGVLDENDKCPNSPAGAKVDANGCCLDSDNDGVKDYADKCPTTPAGAKVDANGCCLDSDKDGVKDYADKCPTTPAGDKVDANGCSIKVDLDGDKDGVLDSADKCPNSPAGAKVDANGCCLDSDNDGVKDYADKCPTTPAGFSVDANGCEISYNLKINFDTNKAVIKPEYNNDITKFVAFMKTFKQYKAEIQGHTDNRGDAKANKSLSQARADSMKAKFVAEGIEANRLTAVGYGEEKPRTTNDTKEGQDENRRIEVILSK